MTPRSTAWYRPIRASPIHAPNMGKVYDRKMNSNTKALENWRPLPKAPAVSSLPRGGAPAVSSLPRGGAPAPLPPKEESDFGKAGANMMLPTYQQGEETA